jgi:hypothetical protein
MGSMLAVLLLRCGCDGWPARVRGTRRGTPALPV